MRPSAFGRPSTAPDFLKEQESLGRDESELLAKLRGDEESVSPPPPTPPSPRRAATPSKPKPAKREPQPRAREDRSHRTTVWLSPTVQRRIRIRALERNQTVSGYLLDLLARDGITDDA